MDENAEPKFLKSQSFRSLLVAASSQAVEQTLTRFGFRVADGPNELQEDMLFLRRFRQGNPLQRIERMELQMAEHERRDEARQKEILDKLEDAKEDRAVTHARITALKADVNSIIKPDGPLESLRRDNRNALLSILGTAFVIIGVLVLKYVMP